MSVFEKEKHRIFRTPCFYMYVFFRVPNCPKIGIFLGFGFSATFGPTPPPSPHPSYFPGVPTLGTSRSFNVELQKN